MSVAISYEAALDGVIESPEDLAFLAQLVRDHKTWGAFQSRVPSYLVVNLIDALKALKEDQLGYYPHPEVGYDDADDVDFSDDD